MMLVVPKELVRFPAYSRNDRGGYSMFAIEQRLNCQLSTLLSTVGEHWVLFCCHRCVQLDANRLVRNKSRPLVTQTDVVNLCAGLAMLLAVPKVLVKFPTYSGNDWDGYSKRENCIEHIAHTSTKAEHARPG